jgi:2-keto-4-pentenoate hydratase/2-oxohepta-3-ene-1,7-dioic acid hydratase in catechol pathway
MKIFGIGFNYINHAGELKSEIPEEPLFFMKPDSSIVKDNKPVFYPNFTNDLQYETEIIIKLNRVGKCINEKFAHRYYNEIGIGIDFTARDIQQVCRDKGLPWEVCKAFDGSAPIGNFMKKSDFPDINNINFRLDINGITVQSGNTGDMIFSFDNIVSHISKYITVKMGDLIFTGTPVGVGPVKTGDHMQAYIESNLLLDFYVR